MFTRREKVGYVVPRNRKLGFEPLERRALLSASSPMDLLGGASATDSASQDSPNPGGGTMQYCHIVNLQPTLGGASVASGSNSTALSAAAGSSTPFASSSPVGFTPTQLRTAYGLNLLSVGINGGAGQTIAIIDAYDDPALVSSTHPGTDSTFASSDFGKFDAAMGLPDPPSFLKVNENGATSPLPAASGTTGWSVEVSLDVEWAHAMAPAANIILIECTSPSDLDLVSNPAAAMGTATNLANVSVVSMSFGRSENSSDAALDSSFTTPVGHTPITYMASTGDSGAPGEFPSDSPNVVAVGGTTLTLGTGSVWANETGWSSGGGGRSSYETEPSYQQTVQTSGFREIPDISSDADPATGVAVYDSYDYGSTTPWAQIGGTSVSSPCWAGMIAVANQLRTSSGLATLDGRKDTLPSLYKLPATDFHDITVGNNGNPAGTGYDMVTGIGSPKANLVLPDLVGISSKGTVAFSTSSYEIGTSATISVSDLDLVGNSTCPVTVTSTAGDSETLNLPAQGGGVFKGSISISTGSVVSGDGILQSVPGGTITVTYHDANDGTGNPATVTAQATTFTVDHYSISTISSPQTASVPFSVTVTAYDTFNKPIPGYAGTVPLTASGTAGTLSVSPTTVTFAAGTWTGNVAVNALDPAVTLQLNNGAGASAKSNTFATQAGSATTFQWSTIASPKSQNVAFPVTLTAKDANGYTATSFNGPVAISGFTGGGGTLDNFEQGSSDLANYTFVSTNNASITSAAAHDGAYGLQLGDTTEWMYRTDTAAQVKQGEVISAWVKSATSSSGRAYFGFGASAGGTLDMAMGENTGELLLQYVAAYGTYNVLASVSQTWLANHWYRFEVTWQTGGTIVGRLYDSDGATLLNTVTASYTSITSGGISFRGFGGTNYFDSVTQGTLVPVSVNPTTVTFVNGNWTGNVAVLQTANNMSLRADDGSGHSGNSNTFNVLALPPLTLSVPANTTEGNPPTNGTISIPVALSSNLVANLTSSDASRLTVPASVTIPAGQTSVSVPITTIDDSLLNGPEAVTITAAASGYFNGTGTVEVHDNETATMTVTLPASAAENSGSIAGTVTASAAPTTNITIQLSSSDTTRLLVPATVVLPAGQTTVNFTATLLDDHKIEGGPTPVTVTSTMDNWTAGFAIVNIQDSDAALTVSLPASGWEGQTATGSVTIGGTLTTPLTVHLSSGDATQLTVPATVTILAGQTTASFMATLVDNGLKTGPQTETVTATASGFTTGTGNILVKDADVDHYTIATISSPQTAGVPFSVTATAYDVKNNPITVYTGTPALSASGAGGKLSVSPATATFTAGTWTGNVTVNAVDPTVTLQLNNGAGASATSNVFATQAGAVASLQWSTIASPEAKNVAFPVTLTAKDANGYTATSYNGSATLSGWIGGGGSGVVPTPGPVSGTGNIKLLGTDLKLGVNADGSLVDQDLSLGANFLGNEFLLPGSPFSAFTLAVNGVDYHNAAASSDSSNPVAMTVQNVSTASALHANATGTASGVQITRDIWFQPGSDAVTFQVKLQNTTTTALSNVAWMEAYDPDQGYPLAGSYSTNNDVLLGGKYVEAVYYYSSTYPNGLTIAMGSSDSRAVAGAQGFNNVDPFVIINSPVDPNGASGDVTSNLAFNVGTLAAGASTTLTYYVVFATDRSVAANLYQTQLRTAVPVAPTTVNFTAGVATTNVTVQQTATGMYLEADGSGGLVGTSNTFNVQALPPLTLSLPANTTEGNPPTNGTISIPVALSSNLVVNLTSSDPGRLTVPASVTIPAGQTSVSVPVTTIDDSLLNGPEAVTITAATSGYFNGTGTVEVHDNETATMTVTLPASAAENSGSIAGTVTASAAPTTNITIQLTSSDTTRLLVPATVVLPAGQTTVNFTATLLDDHKIEGGPTPVTVTSTMDNWTVGSAIVSIQDSDATLAVSLPASGWEGQTAAGTVTIGGTLTAPLTVSLSSGDTTQLTVPATVTIPAGQTTASFTATLVDNGLKTGPQTETVTATASGLTTGTGNILVNDADLDRFTWTAIAATETAGVPFSVTVHAFDVKNNVILVYNGTASLSGMGQAGVLSISPTTVTFVNGVWTGNVTVNAVDPTVTLKLDDGAGHTATSNVFASQPGPVASFQWSTIASPQYANWPITTTITAKDAHGYTATGFNGPANLTAQNGPGTVTVGTGTTTSSLPLYTSYYDCRTQVIYMSSDLGGAGPISSLALNVSSLPGQVLNGWTIRMQETPFSSYSTYSWVGSGWTTVYQANQTISTTGWVTFNFATPFYYDGLQNLLVDFSYHNTSYSSSGYSYATTTSATRSMYYYANGTYGDPKTWSGTTTPSYATTLIPNVRLNIGVPITVTPGTTTNFINGVWTGSVAVSSAATGVTIIANDGSSHIGTTNTFDVLAQPALGLAAPSSATEGVGTITAWLGIPFAMSSDLTINLLSSDPTRLTVPATEIIPAGQTLISFPISIIATGLLEGPEAVTVTASTSRFVTATNTITVHSNETATLSVSLPTSALETDAPVTGAITASAAPAKDITVQLISSATAHLTVPATVTLPAGQKTVSFTALPIDDHLIETLPMPVTVTASVDNWVDGTSTIFVLDNDRTIAVTLPGSAWEGQTVTGTVTLGGLSTSATVVSLSSSDATQLTVPVTVTVLAGQTSASFTATLIDNGLRTGPRTETVTAAAGGLTTGTTNITVKDADVDHYAFSTISTPQADGVAFSVTASAYDVMNNPITVYSSSAVPLSATGGSGSIAISLTSASFTSGVWSGSVTVNAVDPAVVLKLNNGAGATGSSNSFAVQPGAVASFSWSTITSPKGLNVPFAASVTAKDVNGYTATGYNGAAALAGSVGAATTAMLLGEPTPDGSWNNGPFTLGYSFTPSSNILVTDLLHYFGTKVSIWTDAGVLVTSQTYSSTGGVWQDTSLSTPVQLLGGTVYRIACYSAGQTYYRWTSTSHVSALGAIGQDYEISGDAFPTGSFSSNQWWAVDLKAQVSTGVPVAVSPSTVSFVNGVWSGNVTVAQTASNMHLHVDDGSGHSGDSNTFNVLTNATAVVGRYVFYAGSARDGGLGAPNSNDDAAIATDKTALLPGGTASFANYTSYSRGINGIMIDIQNLAHPPVASDFTFMVGNSNSPGSWSAAPAPLSVTVRNGAGISGSSRIEIVWADGAIADEWLQVTVPHAVTGLPADDVFYWGNAIGDTGNSPIDTYVNATDELLTRHNFTASAGITNVADFNRDGVVDLNDVTIVRNNGTNFMSALKLITVPAKLAVNAEGPGSTLTVLSASANTAIVGVPPALTAVVVAGDSMAGTPTGQVFFVDATTGATLGVSLLDDAGRATLAAPALAVGTHGIVAEYVGDDTFSASSSTPVTVTAVNTATWTGDGSNANWGSSANWGGMPLASQIPLSFTGTGGQLTNDLAGMQVNGITFSAESGSFALGGNAVSLTGGISNVSSATQFVGIGITLTGGDAVLNSDSGVLAISGDIGSSGGAYGIVKTGAGTAVLSGKNTYAGPTTVTGGTLVVASATALPSGADITVGNWSNLGAGSNKNAGFAPSETVRVDAAAAAPTRSSAPALLTESGSANTHVAAAATSVSPAVSAAAVLPFQPRATSADAVFAAMAPSVPAATGSRAVMRSAAAILAGYRQSNMDADGGDAPGRLHVVDAALAAWE